MAEDDPKRIIEEKDKLIKRQFIRIEELESELTALKEERDALLCDVNKLTTVSPEHRPPKESFNAHAYELRRLKLFSWMEGGHFHIAVMNFSHVP